MFGSGFGVLSSGFIVPCPATDGRKCVLRAISRGADCVRRSSVGRIPALFGTASPVPFDGHGAWSATIHGPSRVAGVRRLQESRLPPLREGTIGPRLEALRPVGRQSQNHLLDFVDRGYINEEQRSALNGLAEIALEEATGLLKYLQSPEALRNAERARQRRRTRTQNPQRHTQNPASATQNPARRTQNPGRRTQNRTQNPNPEPGTEPEHEPGSENSEP